jgi:hypothetical protein
VGERKGGNFRKIISKLYKNERKAFSILSILSFLEFCQFLLFLQFLLECFKSVELLNIFEVQSNKIPGTVI